VTRKEKKRKEKEKKERGYLGGEGERKGRRTLPLFHSGGAAVAKWEEGGGKKKEKENFSRKKRGRGGDQPFLVHGISQAIIEFRRAEGKGRGKRREGGGRKKGVKKKKGRGG